MPNSDFFHSPAVRGLHGATFAQSAHGDDHVDDDSPDTHRNAPQPDPVCLYGLVGDVARAGSEDTEAVTFRHKGASDFRHIEASWRVSN